MGDPLKRKRSPWTAPLVLALVSEALTIVSVLAHLPRILPATFTVLVVVFLGLDFYLYDRRRR